MANALSQDGPKAFSVSNVIEKVGDLLEGPGLAQ